MNEAPENNSATPEPNPAPIPAPTPNPSNEETIKHILKYPEGMEETVKADNTFKKFADKEGNFDYSKVLTSYYHLEKMVGKNKVALPSKNATSQELRDFYTQLGIPEKIEDYKLENTDTDFSKLGYEEGLHPEKLNKVLRLVNSKLEEANLKDIEAQRFKQDELFNNDIKKVWGKSFDSKYAKTLNAIKYFTTEDEYKALETANIHKHPMFLKIFAKVAENIENDKFEPQVSHGVSNDPVGLAEDLKKVFSDLQKAQKGSYEYEMYLSKYKQLSSKVNLSAYK